MSRITRNKDSIVTLEADLGTSKKLDQLYLKRDGKQTLRIGYVYDSARNVKRITLSGELAEFSTVDLVRLMNDLNISHISDPKSSGTKLSEHGALLGWGVVTTNAEVNLYTVPAKKVLYWFNYDLNAYATAVAVAMESNLFFRGLGAIPTTDFYVCHLQAGANEGTGAMHTQNAMGGTIILPEAWQIRLQADANTTAEAMIVGVVCDA